MTAIDTHAHRVVAQSLLLLLSLGCTADNAVPDAKPKVEADEPAMDWAGSSVRVPNEREASPRPSTLQAPTKASDLEAPTKASDLEAPTKAVEPEPKPVDNQAARQKHGLGKQPKDQLWSVIPGLTAFEALTALCLDYKLAADVVGERTTDEWIKYVAKRKGMKPDQLKKVYGAWMAYAFEDPNRGADPSGPEAAYCTWD